jgi:hypothetical protein
VGEGVGDRNSDIAFWGRHAFQGHFTGFRIIDISDHEDPVEIVDVENCGVGRDSTVGGQGDVVVWDDILVRTWDGAEGGSCGDLPGVSGLHIFDISDLAAPEAIGVVDLPDGSHTATGVPDLENDRLLVYSSPSSAGGIDIVEVPLDDPASASFLRRVPSGIPGQLPNIVTIDPPSPAAGTYQATGAAFGPAPDETGVSGDVVLVDDGVGTTTDGCEPLVDFPAGAVALLDRGSCNFTVKVANAQAAGATATIVANNAPGAPITMGGTDPTIGIPAVMVSLDDGDTIKAGLPATGTITSNPAPQVRNCHDTNVILGDVMRAACAGGNGVTVWSMHSDDGGSLEEPQLQWSRAISGVTIGHSAAWTWDGETVVFGHEPGGGVEARCQATSAEVDRTLFFLDGETGDTVGTFVHPRPQEATENCTWHNFNVVPTDRRHILVSGNYQSGVSVVDFTDLDNIREIAFADPAPLEHPTTPGAILRGGDWASHWYNGRIYESDTRRGLIIWNLTDPAVAGAKKLPHFNPQTQETSFPFKGTVSASEG